MAEHQKKACCGPGSATALGRDAEFLRRADDIAQAPAAIRAELAARLKPIPGGIFEMGARKSSFPADLDSPRRKVKLSGFLMAPCAVTNAEYARFVRATGYRTVAEQEGWSFVFHLLLADPADFPASPPGLPWWRQVKGACWAMPEGPDSDLSARGDHPVTHITWYDAQAYCNWSGLRLPHEAEWERAARGGLVRRKFPWGDDFMPGGTHAMNTFQGEFPHYHKAEDGWIGTAPVDSFRSNAYGMFNMTGNVWEWVQDYFGDRPPASGLPLRGPTGPATGHARVQRGGSYLCHVSYCDRYHVHSRTRNDPDSSTGNCGFRVAASQIGADVTAG